MKRIFLVLLVFLTAIVTQAQERTDSLPYLRFPQLPPIQLLLGDSTTLFTKNSLAKSKPVLVMFFGPGCSHCQRITEELVRLKDSLPDMQLVMATFASISEINDFRKKYHTDLLPETTIGKDIYFLLPPFYGIAYLPYWAYYDNGGHFAESFDGTTPLEKILARIRVLNTRKK